MKSPEPSPVEFPVDRVVSDLRTALQNNANAVLVAEPGAGKTTRVPLALKDESWLKDRKIVMLEPRRLAARAAAKRMADTLGEELGATVGYTVRLERKVSSKTKIEVVTEGLLTRRLQHDPELKDVGLLIFDEFHERSLDGDLGLALALDVQRGLREDLRILVMSATLDSEALSKHLGNAPVIETHGRMFPVAVTHLDRATRQTIVDDTVKAITRAFRETKGSLLVFLPGEGEIRRVEEKLLASSLPSGVDVRPLYGAMALADQDAAIRPSPDGRRKIVLATTIAETSLTIEGIEAVVDVGFKRVPRFDPASAMTALETLRVSQASAEQRKGRAGRLGPGHCYRLWPEVEMKSLAPHDEPEIHQADLAGVVLDLANWGVSTADGLPWFEEPPKAAFAQAQGLLKQLEAVDTDGRITALGKRMGQLPLHPRLAHMVVKGEELGAAESAAELAAFLSERDGLPRDTTADVEHRLLMVRGTAKDRIRQAACQIKEAARLSKDSAEVPLGVLVALAYPDRIARKRGAGQRYLMASGGGAVLAEHDSLGKAEWLAIAQLDGTAGDGKARLAAPLALQQIEKYFPYLISEVEGTFWDSKSASVKSGRRKTVGAILIGEKPSNASDPEKIAESMLQGVKELGLASLPWNEGTRNFQARAQFLHRIMPEAGFPDLSDAMLSSSMEEWLLPYLSGMMRKSDLVRLDMHAILQGLMPHDLLRRMEKLAPSRITVPGGGHYRIDYEGEGDPILRVRLQEMFGLKSAPEVADGRARLKIELLSPAGRPVAVTQSLETFWRDAYPDVRKDMRGRYPKHPWPEDPLSAKPLAPRKVR
jgi:ATP-dependent helicase HrpB